MKNKPSSSNSSRQELLTLNEKKPYVSKGPIFDSKKYLRSSKSKYIAAAVVVLVIAAALFIRFSGNEETAQAPENNQTISVTAAPRDSYTKLARQAVSEYLKTHADVSLSSAQRLFVETSLVQNMSRPPLQIGTSVEFKVSDVEALIGKSQNLTATQIKAWTDLSKNIQF